MLVDDIFIVLDCIKLLQITMTISVSIHYVIHTTMHSIAVLHVGMLHKGR